MAVDCQHIFLYYILSAVYIIASGHDDLGINCKYLKYVPSKWSSIETDMDINNIALDCRINANNETANVSIDLISDIIFDYRQNYSRQCSTSRLCDVDVYFECENGTTTVDFARTTERNIQLLTSIRIRNCVISWDDLNHLGTKVQLRLVQSVIDDWSPTITAARNESDLPGLSNIAEIELTFDQMQTPVYIHNFLPIQAPTPTNVSVLTLHCFLPYNRDYNNHTHCRPGQIIFDPVKLNESFPYLQSLGLMRVFPIVDSNISFPWFPVRQQISNGLERSSYYSHLSYTSHADRNMTRRILSIQHIRSLDINIVCPINNVMNQIVIRQCDVFPYFPKDCFWNVKDLKFLDISFNPITYIHKELLRNHSSLVVLYIRNTNLTHFPDTIFDDLVNLNLLAISRNRLKHLQSGLFIKLQNLVTFSAFGNEINHVDHQTLPVGSRKLQYIDFESNMLLRVPIDCHFILTYSMICNLDHNNITIGNATDTLREYNPVINNMAKPLAYYGQIPGVLHESNLHEVVFSVLSLRYNDITNLDAVSYFGPNTTSHDRENALAALLSYTKLILETDQPTSKLFCDCALFELRLFIMKKMDNIVKQYLYWNIQLPDKRKTFDWYCTPFRILKNKTNGHFLDMDPQNFICKDTKVVCFERCTCYRRTHVEPTLFVDCKDRGIGPFMPKLNIVIPIGYKFVVDLGSNVIETFPECGSEGYAWLALVTSLDISDNRQGNATETELEAFFRCLANITRLYIDMTGFKYLPRQVMETMTKDITEIAIPNDTLLCDCTQYWLKSWLQKLKRRVTNNYQHIFCGGEDKSGFPIVQLEESDFVCHGFAADMKYIVAGSAAVIAIFILVLTCFSYRFEISVLIYEKLNLHPFDRQTEEPDKKYDTYIMYADHDYRWAQNTLLVGLERNRYRVADSLRDSMPGRCTEEEMAEFISQSHRVLVVLSKHFIEDESLMSDFYRAETQGKSYGNRRFLIIVTLQKNINIRDHPVFARYINTNYFIPHNSRRFWHRLFYWLPAINHSTRLPSTEENLPHFESAENELESSQQADLNELSPLL